MLQHNLPSCGYSQLHAVQPGINRVEACRHSIAVSTVHYLVELEPDSATDILLAGINSSLQSFLLWAEPETIVHQLCIPT